MSYTLLIDTSTERGIAAIGLGSKLFAEKALPYGYQSSRHLMGAIESFGISPQEIGAIGVGVGPGSYTGIRVGVAAAVGMSIALGCPLVGFCSLEGFVSEKEGPFTSVIDARIGAYVLLQERVGGETRLRSEPRRYLDDALNLSGIVVGPSLARLQIGEEVGPNASHLLIVISKRLERGEFTLEGKVEILYPSQEGCLNSTIKTTTGVSDSLISACSSPMGPTAYQ